MKKLAGLAVAFAIVLPVQAGSVMQLTCVISAAELVRDMELNIDMDARTVNMAPAVLSGQTMTWETETGAATLKWEFSRDSGFVSASTADVPNLITGQCGAVKR